MTLRNCTKAIIRITTLGSVGLLAGCSRQLALLHPDGPVGAHEMTIMMIAFALMLLVVIPVFAMTAIFAWRYRASNKRATYAPKWARSRIIEVVVWAVPALIVGALGYLSWTTTHALGPYRPLASAEKPLRVEAVAMNWKWLFIYPQQHIATVNKLVIPAGVPVDFRLTSTSVMTSFFVPRLGSQVYAMPGMRTELHLLADKPGSYTGRNYQFSGRGYASMHFKVDATSRHGFASWVAKVKQSNSNLDAARLQHLEHPSVGNPVTIYASVGPHLFDHLVRQVQTAGAGRQAPPARSGA